MKNSEDPVRKLPNLAGQGAHLIQRETNDKGPHADGVRLWKTRELTPGKGGRGMGRGGPRPAGPTHFEVQSAPL
jgi:hypothetical protein